MIRTNWPDGVFPCVALDAGKGWMAVRAGDPRVAGDLIVYEWDGDDLDHAREIRRWSLKAGSPCFPDLYVLDGVRWLAYNDGAQLNLWNLTMSKQRQFTALSNPTAFGGGYFAYCEPGIPYRVLRVDLRTGEVTQPRLGAPTGLARILDNGTVVTVDEDRLLEGPHATNPRFAGRLTVYEYDDAHVSGCGWEFGPTLGLLWPTQLAFTPDVATDGARFAIATAGSGSTRVFCGTFAELLATNQPAPPPVQPPNEPPHPEPVPQPPPPENPTMRLPDGVQQIVNALYAAHLDLANGTDDQRRQLTQLIVEQTVYSFPSDGWGWKSADPNRPLSKDSIAKQQDGRLLNFDLFNGGTRQPNDHPASEDITGQTFRPWPGVDHLGAGTPAPSLPPSAPPSDPSGGNGAVLDAQIAALSARVSAYDKRLTALEARPIANGSDFSLTGVKVALRSDNAHFLSADQGGGGGVTADREAVGGWEVWTILEQK